MTTSEENARSAARLIGKIFAERYRILSVVGQGGMGVVYKAEHTLMGRIVAIKMLLPEVVSDNSSIMRFQQEARAASALSHPNIVTAYDFGVTPNREVYLVMDFLNGRSLDAILSETPVLAPALFGKTFLQVCDAMQHAHATGIIHRDIKSSNIMLVDTQKEKNVVKIVDFGLAKLVAPELDQQLTTIGTVMGSPIFMSPEQCRGLQCDERSDIYSLGCVMYRCLTGTMPIKGETALDTMNQHISVIPRPFSQVNPASTIPDRLENLVMRMLAKSPAERPQTMSEVADELNRILNAMQNPAPMMLHSEATLPVRASDANPSYARAADASTSSAGASPARALAAGVDEATSVVGAKSSKVSSAVPAQSANSAAAAITGGALQSGVTDAEQSAVNAGHARAADPAATPENLRATVFTGTDVPAEKRKSSVNPTVTAATVLALVAGVALAAGWTRLTSGGAPVMPARQSLTPAADTTRAVRQAAATAPPINQSSSPPLAPAAQSGLSTRSAALTPPASRGAIPPAQPPAQIPPAQPPGRMPPHAQTNKAISSRSPNPKQTNVARTPVTDEHPHENQPNKRPEAVEKNLKIPGSSQPHSASAVPDKDWKQLAMLPAPGPKKPEPKKPEPKKPEPKQPAAINSSSRQSAPDNAAALEKSAAARFDQRNYAEAEKLYRRSFEQRLAAGETDKGKLLFDLVRVMACCGQQGQTIRANLFNDKVVRLFESAGHQCDNRPGVLLAVARIYADRNLWDKSAKCCQRAIEALKKQPHANPSEFMLPLDHLAKAYFKQRKFPQALDTLRDAIKISDGHLEMIGYDDVREHYQEVLEEQTPPKGPRPAKPSPKSSRHGKMIIQSYR